MSFHHSASLIPLKLWDDSFRHSRKFRRFLGASILFHSLLFGLMINLRLVHHVDHLAPSYHVSLVSLADVMQTVPPSVAKPKSTPQKKPERKSVAVSKPKPQPKPKLQKSTPVEPPVPVALPVVPSRPVQERLSDSFAGVMDGIVVPQERQVSARPNTIVKPSPVPRKEKTDAGEEQVPLPPTVPQFAPLLQASEAKDRMAPPLPADNLSASLKKTVESVHVPPLRPSSKKTGEATTSMSSEAAEETTHQSLLPRAPDLKALHPQSETAKAEPPSSRKKLTDSLKKVLQSVVVPNPQMPKSEKSSTASTKKNKISPSPESVREKSAPAPVSQPLTESLKEVVQAVVVPKTRPSTRSRPSAVPTPTPSVQKEPAVDKAREALREVILPPQAPDFTKLKQKSPDTHPDSAEVQKMSSELSQQIAKLTIPEVEAPVKDMKILEVLRQFERRTERDLQLPGKAKEGNPYWGKVRAQIDQEWIAAPVELPAGQPKTIIAFRLERSGKVKNVRITQSSGNQFFDLAAKRAVLAAEPLPPFPDDMSESYYDLQFQFSVRKDRP